MQVKRYGRIDTGPVAEVRCLWCGSFHMQPVRVILLRDDDTAIGYDLALVTTDLGLMEGSTTLPDHPALPAPRNSRDHAHKRIRRSRRTGP